MSTPITPREPKPAAALAAVVALVFVTTAWTQGFLLLEPEDTSDAEWLWTLLHLTSLLPGVGGAWWVWLSARRAPLVVGLSLGAMGLLVVLNAYTGLFGENDGDVWRTLNALFIGCASVAAVSLWQLGSVAARAGAALSGAAGAALLANAYFLGIGDAWQYINPVMAAASLAWAVVVARAGAGGDTDAGA